jgi:predicted nucleic acid-binding protein
MKPMQGRCFLDTNILLYLLSKDVEKKNIAKKLLKENHAISIQVLNEFSNVSLRRFKLSVSETKEIIDKISQSCKVYPYNKETILTALDLKERYRYQFYDSLILATALENGCDIVYSEDMQHNHILENRLTIINPFRG